MTIPYSKTTLRLPRILLKQAKQKAVLEDTSLGMVVEEALAEYLLSKQPRNITKERAAFYQWADRLALKNGFSRLTEEDVADLVDAVRRRT